MSDTKIDDDNVVIRSIKEAEICHVNVLFKFPESGSPSYRAFIRGLKKRASEDIYVNLQNAVEALVADFNESNVENVVLAIRANESCRIRVAKFEKKITARAVANQEESWAGDVTRASAKFNNARQKLIRLYKGYLAANVNKYRMVCNSELTDLFQEAAMGMCRAVDKFDPDKGFKFITYAGWWVRHYIRRAISDKGRLVRVPVHISDGIAIVTKAAYDQRRSGKEFDAGEIATKLGVSVEKVKSVLNASRSDTKSLNDPMIHGETGGISFLDAIRSEDPDSFDILHSNGVIRDVKKALSELPDRERVIMIKRFGIGVQPQCLQEIGDEMKLSRERIRQLEAKAMSWMKRHPAMYRHRDALV